MELPVALLTALGMQPPDAVPVVARDGLRDIVIGREVHRRRWIDFERSHALTAMARLGVDGIDARMAHLVTRARVGGDVRRAAYLAMGARAEAARPGTRSTTWRALATGVGREKDPLSTGLALVGLGRVVRAALAAPGAEAEGPAAPLELLQREADGGNSTTRGFAALGLGLALRGVAPESKAYAAAVAAGRRVLLGCLERTGDDHLAGAFAVALGLSGAEGAVPALAGVVEDPRRSEALRGHAAEGLALLGARSPEAVRALVVALSEPNAEVLRRQAALALSVLDAPFASSHLLREPGTAKTEHLMAQLAVCVGRLDDLSAVEPLLAVARDPRRGELTRALAVVSLGHLADPERRPVLHRLSIDANYPARTDALHSAFMIL